MFESLKNSQNNGNKVHVFLVSGRSFTAQVSALYSFDGSVLFKDLCIDGTNLSSLEVSLSKIEAVGEFEESGDDESAYSLKKSSFD